MGEEGSEFMEEGSFITYLAMYMMEEMVLRVCVGSNISFK
jgi:hypothetical protein